MAGRSEGNGCLKIFLVVLGIAIVAAVGCSFLIYKSGGALIRSGSASVFEQFASETLKDLPYDSAKKANIKKHFDDFASKIRDGKVGLEEGTMRIATLSTGPFFSLTIVEKVLLVHLPKSGLTVSQRESARQSLLRFAEGVSSEAIDFGKALKVVEGKKTTDPSEHNSDIYSSRRNLSDSILLELVGRADKAADEAGIPAGDYQIDLEKVIRELFASPNVTFESFGKTIQQVDQTPNYPAPN